MSREGVQELQDGGGRERLRPNRAARAIRALRLVPAPQLLIPNFVFCI
jgi:hypothetical protein